jgi:transposase
MLSLPPAVRLFLCTAPTDLRRSFDGLACLAETVLRQDPFSGHLFLFRNKRGDRLKALHWDRDGYVIWYKRLEQGTFRFPAAPGAVHEISAADLALILEGIDLTSVRRQVRYRRPAASTAAEGPPTASS